MGSDFNTHHTAMKNEGKNNTIKPSKQHNVLLSRNISVTHFQHNYLNYFGLCSFKKAVIFNRSLSVIDFGFLLDHFIIFLDVQC